MIQDLHSMTEDERHTHQQLWGTYNEFPEGWHEVTEAELVERSLWRIYTPMLLEHRQMGKLVAGSGPLLDATLFFFHDFTGCGMHWDYWGKRIRWFMFGCVHNYREISRPAGHRSGIHKDKCSKCGYVREYDTSD